MPTDPTSGDATLFGADLYRDTWPLHQGDSTNGYQAKVLLYGLGRMFSQSETYGRSQTTGEPPWAVLFQPDKIPANGLNWLSRVAGVRLPVVATETQKRTLIKTAPGRTRGTYTAFVMAGKAQLTGSKYLKVVERDGSAYKLSVYARTAEVPNTRRFLDALVSQKPAGIKMTVTITNAAAYNEKSGTYDAQSTTYDFA